MLKNYIKIAWRNIVRSKAYSFINISGLSLGIACCLMLALYVQDEFSYDQHHERLEDLYRINTKFDHGLGFDDQPSCSPPIGMTVKEEVPEIESAVRIIHPIGDTQGLIRYGDNVFYEMDGFIADSTLFDVFTYELKEGNPEKALADANTIVISDKLAYKLFGDEPALNKMIGLSEGGPEVSFKITGVFLDNRKSFIHANYFTSMMSEGWGSFIRTDPGTANEWAGQNFIPTYVKLNKNHNKTTVDKKINDVLIAHGAESMKKLGLHKTLYLEPVKDIYLRSVVDKNPRITYIYVIVSIAAFILLIGCINFMNLSTAKAMKRATEIGVRKVMGAYRSSLIKQILGEAMIIVWVAILLSVGMVQLLLPYFNEISGKSISFSQENMLYFSGALIALAIITGLLAGSYPAFHISSFRPAEVLKGKVTNTGASGRLRQVLVVFQFMIAIVLVCGMIVISKQLTFMRERDLGFDASAKIVLPLRTANAQKHYSTLKNELIKNNSVKLISATQYVPGVRIYSDMMFYTQGGSMDDAVDILRNTVDAGYIELLDIPILAGRSFTENRELESQAKVIINKTAADKLGIEPDKIVGQQIHFDWQDKKYSFEVLGVMDDFNQTSLKEKIMPTLFEIAEDPDQYQFLMASVNAQDFERTIAAIRDTWTSLISDTPFEYTFLEDNIQKQYVEDQKMSTIITSFTIIAMIISCLGLYGLSTYMAERRFKEIGVRKVLGASIQQIVSMMSKEFVKLVVFAFILAVPLSWYIMHQWLEGFEYKIPLEVTIFLYAGAIAIAIALFTISFQSIRAASGNPVDALRNE